MILRTWNLALVLSAVLAGVVRAQEPTTYVPRPSREDGSELLAVVVSAGYCQDSQRTDYRESIARMKLSLSEAAAERGHAFAVVGVSVDWAAEEGLRHLERLGQFDQLVVGGGWANLAGVELLELRPTGDVTTPQVLVLERTVRWGDRTLEVSGERLVHRVIGVDAIVRWASEGFPLR